MIILSEDGGMAWCRLNFNVIFVVDSWLQHWNEQRVVSYGKGLHIGLVGKIYLPLSIGTCLPYSSYIEAPLSHCV